jgi:hypothetical protein
MARQSNAKLGFGADGKAKNVKAATAKNGAGWQ